MNHATYFHRVKQQTPTGMWINNVTQKEAQMAIEAGASGCTQNPSYIWKMLNHPKNVDHARQLLNELIRQYDNDDDVMIALQRSLVGEIAEIFMPMYQSSAGREGYVSIQGDPFHEDVQTILKSARFNREAGANIMAKIPVTPDGLTAIETLVSEGVPINATEVMSVRQALDVCTVYERATRGVKNPPPIYFSHIAGIFDEYIAKYAIDIKADVPKDYLWQAGLAVARKVDQAVMETGIPVGFISGGARGLHHYTEMVGCKCVITINWSGTADKLLEQDPPVVQRFLAPVPYSVIDTLCEKLPDFRKAYEVNAIKPEEYEEFGPVALFRSSFESAWRNALDMVAQERTAM